MKNTLRLYVASLISSAFAPLCYADGGTTGGGAKAAEATPEYPFEGVLRELIMDSLKDSDQVILGDGAVDHVENMDESNPLWTLGGNITERFSTYLFENGIEPKTFAGLQADPVEGQIVDEEPTDAAQQTQTGK